jgi:hypothetical protein
MHVLLTIPIRRGLVMVCRLPSLFKPMSQKTVWRTGAGSLRACGQALLRSREALPWTNGRKGCDESDLLTHQWTTVLILLAKGID